jgi:hypothetical protein
LRCRPTASWAEFWLAQQRPSDARLNIARIEEVDPYYAQQIVMGQIDENRCMLPELDYQRLVEREMATADPDWLNTLSRGEGRRQQRRGVRRRISLAVRA